MSAHVLVTGTLFRPPEQRTSKSGKPFVTGTIRVKDGEALQWWKVLAFPESVQAELMRLADGDPISVQGVFKAELYEKDGEKRLSLSIVADRVLALKAERRNKGKHEPVHRELARNEMPFNDPMPF